MLERRKSLRFSVEADVEWRLDTPEGHLNSPHISRIRNLSTGGLSAMLDDRILPGATLNIEIDLSPEKVIRTQARVAWTNDRERIKGWDIALSEGGIEFLNLDDGKAFKYPFSQGRSKSVAPIKKWSRMLVFATFCTFIQN